MKKSTENDWQIKAWGKTRPLVVKDVFQEHQLHVKAGGYCSIHFHLHRANRFRIESGCIGVVLFRGWTWARSILTAGDTFDVPSQVVHRFEVYEPGTVYEEYWPDRSAPTIATDDIVRIVIGDIIGLPEGRSSQIAAFEANIQTLMEQVNA